MLGDTIRYSSGLKGFDTDCIRVMPPKITRLVLTEKVNNNIGLLFSTDDIAKLLGFRMMGR